MDRADKARMQNTTMPAPCAALLERIGGDEQVLGEVCDLFIEDAPNRLNDILAALNAGDAASVGRAAHAFKGAVSVFDAVAIVAIARRLETQAASGDLAAGKATWAALETETRALIDTLRTFRLENDPCRS
jgi:two-component system sensor histidine kinase/response regulator